MDGERKECPIEPDKIVKLNIAGTELIIAPSHDSIQLFPDSRYSYLRYYDTPEGQIRMVWLPQDVLADLFDMGIPHTVRESITESEYEGYQTYLSRLSMRDVEVEEVEEPLALPAGDPIDAEVQKAHEHLDDEIAYYFKEWTE
jgi:hypothetical protein